MRLKLSIIVWGLVALSIIGCSRDPKARSARFVASGQRYMTKSQYEAASIQFRRAVQADSSSAEAHYQLASALGKMGRWPEALRELQATTQIDDKHIAAHLSSAEILLAGRQNQAARQEITKVLSVDQNNFEAHLLLGNSWFADQNYKSALDEYAICQQLKPSNASGFVQSGLVHLRQGAYPKSVDILQRAVDADSTFVPAYIYLAQAYALQGDSNAEIGILEKGIEGNPKQIVLYALTAEQYLKQGRREQVASLFDKLRSQTGDGLEALVAIGDFYFRAGDAQHAREILAKALDRNPKNDVVLRRLIEVALNQQDWDYAEKLNKTLSAEKPKDVEARLFEARLQFARGARGKAVESLEQLVHDSPELPLPHFYLGIAYARQGESARAVSAFNDAVQKNPNFIWGYVSLGELYAQQGSPKLALDFANQALKRNPTFLPARLLEAGALMQTGDTDAAIAKLRALLAADPHNAMISERLGVALANKQDYRGAADQFEASLTSDPSYAPALLDLIKVYVIQKRPQEIMKRVQLQIQRAPTQARFYEIVGDLSLSDKKLDDALSAYATAAKLNPNSAVAVMGLSRTHAAQGKREDGINDARNLLNMHPDYLAGYVELGQLLEESGNFPEAEQVYQHALERNDEYVPALNNLAWLYCEHGGNLDMALSLAQKAKARFPADPAISDTLAWIEYRKGMFDTAASSLKDVVNHSPQNPVYQYHYGMTLWKLAHAADARTALQRAIQLDLPATEAGEAKRALLALSADARDDSRTPISQN